MRAAPQATNRFSVTPEILDLPLFVWMPKARLLERKPVITLTKLYNTLASGLGHAHRALDEAVVDAYGWDEDYRAGTLTDDGVLARQFRLNQQRAGG